MQKGSEATAALAQSKLLPFMWWWGLAPGLAHISEGLSRWATPSALLLLVYIETGSHYVSQASLELTL